MTVNCKNYSNLEVVDQNDLRLSPKVLSTNWGFDGSKMEVRYFKDTKETVAVIIN